MRELKQENRSCSLGVGVVIPWGKEEGINRCIDSTLIQSYRVEQVVVLANGDVSREAFLAHKEKYAALSEVTFVFLNNCRNANIARNIGMLLLSTDLVAFVDSDDWWDRTHIEESVERLQMGQVDLVYSGMRIYRQGGIEDKFAKDFSEMGGMRNYCLSYLAAPTSSLVARREKALTIMWDWQLRRHQDYDFKARFCDIYAALHKQSITVNIDWVISDRAVIFSDCFYLLESWKGKVDRSLYWSHYVGLVKGAWRARDPIFLKKCLVGLWYALLLSHKKLSRKIKN